MQRVASDDAGLANRSKVRTVLITCSQKHKHNTSTSGTSSDSCHHFLAVEGGMDLSYGQDITI